MSATTLAPVRHRIESDVGFFAHHGVWSPGVRLFRRLDFRAKAAIVTGVFLLPIALLAWTYLKDKDEAVGFSAKERTGVAYVRAAMPLIRYGQAARTATLAEGQAPPAPVAGRAASFERLDAAEQALGTELGTAKAHAAARAAAAAAESAGSQARFAARTAFVDAVLALITQAADGSNLTLDPDLDTYYLMDASVTTIPLLAEAMAQMSDAAAAAAGGDKAAEAGGDRAVEPVAARSGVDTVKSSDAGKPPGVDFARSIASAAVVSQLMQQRLEAALAKVVEVHPEDRAAFAAETLGAQLRAFRELAGSSSADRARLLAEGRAVVDALYLLQGRTLDRLDALLVARVDGLVSHRAWTLAAVAASLLAAAYLLYAFYLVTQGGLAEVHRHLLAMADGDLTTNPQPWGDDEAASLMGSVRRMQTALRAIVARVRQSSASIVTASAEIAAASMDLSTRTEHTAANLEKSAASMEQIAATVTQTADNVNEVARVAAGNSDAAEKGGAVIADVVETMRGIDESSRRIADIISTIDGIAFRTNILALNAAVEAARAGEQGRGFAVVAGEVRGLAQRCASAATEIRQLITSSVEKVASGSRVAEGAGVSMRVLVDNARRMNDLLSTIATAASEQSTGVSQVGTSVNDLDRATQQNAALVEQTAAAAVTLRDRATELAAAVDLFHLPAEG